MNKKSSLKKTIYFFCAALPLFAAGCTTTEIAGNHTWQNHEHISYGGDNLQYIDVSLPAAITPVKMNAMLFIHGFNGGKMDYWTLLDNYRASFVVGIMNYRNIGQNGVAAADIIEDVDNAIIAIKTLAKNNGILLHKIIIMGHSLGGAMTLLYSYNFLRKTSALPVAFCVDFAGFTDLTDAVFINQYRDKITPWEHFPNLMSLALKTPVTEDDMTGFGFTESAKETLKQFSPLYHIKSGVPPTIIIHDTKDLTVPFSQAASLNVALENKHIPHVFIPTTNNLGHHFNGLFKNNSGKSTVTFTESFEAKVIESINIYIKKFCN